MHNALFQNGYPVSISSKKYFVIAQANQNCFGKLSKTGNSWKYNLARKSLQQFEGTWPMLQLPGLERTTSHFETKLVTARAESVPICTSVERGARCIVIISYHFFLAAFCFLYCIVFGPYSSTALCVSTIYIAIKIRHDAVSARAAAAAQAAQAAANKQGREYILFDRSIDIEGQELKASRHLREECSRLNISHFPSSER